MLFIVALVITFSCTTEKKLHKAETQLNKILVKYPQLLTTDTIKIKDTIVVPGAISVREVKEPESIGDTVNYYDNGIIISIYKYAADSFRVFAKCPTDTIYKERIVYRYKYRNCPDQKNKESGDLKPNKKFKIGKKEKPWYKEFLRVPWWFKIVSIICALALLLAMIARIIK
jgi:hypothetical protein